MKRVFGLLLAVVMSIGIAGMCFAADVDLKSMSIEDLIALKVSVEEEIQARIGDSDVIYEGVYQVGKDIKAGKYLMTCCKDDPDSSSSDVDFCYYTNEEAYKTKGGITLGDFEYRTYLKYEESTGINLEDGGYLYIMSGESTLQPYAASWMVTD